MTPRPLPAPATRFFGRGADLEVIRQWFATRHRLVVIAGPPGMGKTRVAIEYAAAHAAGGGNVRFCDLTEVRDRDELCTHVAACLGLALEPGADVAASIGLALRDGGELLVLDNFEQLVEPGAVTVARWLARAPGARLLVTSRERLRIDGEVVHELEPLGEADELFVDRARQLRRDFAVGPGDAAAIAEIVRRLDGIPLAIEVAAARMEVMGPVTLLERLPRRLDLLASNRRDATARQATLRGAIDGSWNALSPPAQAALAQASVFRGGFTLDAAEAVIDLSAHAEAPAIVDVLAGLRAKSLLRGHGGSERAAELRFGLYESIRDYAAERLAASGDAAATRARHGRYYTARFAAGERASRSMKSVGELLAERDNLLAVIEDTLAGPVTAEATRTAGEALLAIDPVLPRSGPSETHLAWLDAVLARPPALLDAALRANLLLARGRALIARARFDASLASFEEVRATAAGLGEPRLEARALIGIGIAHHRSHRDGDAAPPFERALALLGGGDLRRESVVHGYLGAIEQHAGRVAAARGHYRDALRAIETGRPHNRAFLEATVRLRLGFLALDEGDLAAAEHECEQCIALAGAARSRRLSGLGTSLLALIRWSQGRLDDAAALIARSVQTLGDARDHLNEGYAQAIRGAILAALDQVDEAGAAFDRADTALHEVDDAVGAAVSAIYHGHLDLARARRAAAAGDAARATAHRAEAAARLASPAIDPRVTPGRVALATLRRALAAAPAAEPGSADDTDALWVDRDRRAIRAPGRVRWLLLGRRDVLWNLLLALCEARLRAPGVAVSSDALFVAGWPGQSVLPTAAQNRLHVGINSLRKLGLRQWIVTRDDGYLLTPTIAVRWQRTAKKS